MYQVTVNSEVVAEFGNKYDATQFATRLFVTRAARGKFVSIVRNA